MTALINKFVAWLRSPYPELRQRWKTVVLPSLLVFFILYFLQPFGISRMEENRFLVLSGYALVSMAMLAVVVYVFPVLFPAWHREERWTLGKELLATLLMCVLVTLGNWCYTAWTFRLDLDLRLLYVCLLWMVFIGPFPIVLFMMWNRNLQLKLEGQKKPLRSMRLVCCMQRLTAIMYVCTIWTEREKLLRSCCALP